MAANRDFRILVASDGSLAATAALVTTVSWPWPDPSRAFGVVAEQPPVDGRARLRTATTRGAEDVRTGMLKTLERRWPTARASRYAGEPASVIVRYARRIAPDVIAMGWRGHGVMRRLLVGSVSRNVVRHAPCSVLVVRRASRNLRRVVLGYDGSPNAGRAVEWIARLTQDQRRVALVMAVQLMQVPSQTLIGGAIRQGVGADVARANAKRLQLARRTLENAAKPLRDAGWRVDYIVTKRAPLPAVLDACASESADLLVLGATGATGLRGLLLGSVAQGALDRSRTPVLIVR
jgi:nucleotide-binding universal stress UspA family protein